MQDFLDRSFPILREEGIAALSKPLIAISGLGGVGGGAFLNLVRCGVKRFRLAENGIFDPPDMNRQAAAFASTMDRPKIEVYEQLAREINPEIELELFPEGVLANNLDRFLDGSDAYVGVMDMEKGADVKAMTPEMLKRFDIPLFTAAAVGFGALLVAHHPEGMMPDEFWSILQKKSTGKGLLPSSISGRFSRTTMERICAAAKTGKTATTSIGGALSGTMLASEVLLYFLRGTDLVSRDCIFAPKFAIIDLFRPAMEVVDITDTSLSYRNNDMKKLRYPTLQYRWEVKETGDGMQLIYFGLRKPPNQTKSIIPLPRELGEHLQLLNGRIATDDLPSGLTDHEMYARLIAEGIIVEADQKRQPSTRDNFQQCVHCITNDYVLPGLEFDENGLCAFCQCYELAEKSGQDAALQLEGVTDEELLRISSDNTASRFDVMVLYTGGKDSTYLLWYLAKKLRLRVLAATWDMPYTNDTCRENMRRAMRILPDVEFVERTMPWNVTRRAMRDQFEYIGAPCLCPMIAQSLFYPMAMQENIPLIMQGVEDVQLAVMNYVMSGIKSGQPQKSQARDHRAATLNFLRMITRAPEPGQPYSLGAEVLQIMGALKKVLPSVCRTLDDIVTRAENDPDMQIPILRRLRSNATYGTWAEVVELIKKEMDWRMPPGQKGLLHTSCRIEKVKDYCQFKRFQGTATAFFPQSIVELGAGVYFGLISREKALEELQELGYYDAPPMLSSVISDLDINPGQEQTLGEISWVLGK